ncbi:MAG: HAMP domain-containing histidine kinase [Ruminococcus sp.]|nr:HAMP domain-containing histidine kinase [Ruminococcus sp.]
MFRKVQLKFFGIITSILLAIFIAVLGSINIIMDTVMEHQTKIVLEQVAAGVEYDGMTKRFFIERPDDENWQRFDDYQRTEPPSKPDMKPSDAPTTQTEAVSTEGETSETVVTSSATTYEETEPPQTTPPPETQAPAPQTTRAPETQPTWAKTTRATAYKPVTTTEAVRTTQEWRTQPPQTQPPQTQPPQTQPPQTAPPPETTTQADWGGGQPVWGPWGPWYPWWMYGGDGNNNGGSDGNNGGGIYNDYWKPQEETVSGMANNEFIPVLDGYTIINDDSQTTTTAVTSEATTTAPPPVPRAPVPANGGEYDKESVPRSLGSIDFFLLMADEDGKLVGIQNNDEMSDEVAQQYVTEILSKKADSGMANSYQFCTEKKDNGTLMVFTDKSAEIDMMNKLKRTTVIVGLISIVILSAAAYFLSGLIVRPIQVAFDKQKQFISDASHELKTPLTVISANADVLEGEIGENKWLTYIQDQADRMNVLVNDLLNLTRLENNSNFIVSEFDLSKAIANTALPFECRAFDAGKNFVLNIEDGIRISGSEQHIKQMAAIFIDNALKYSKEKGTVRVSLTNDGGKIRFSVYNTGTGLKESEKEKVFERFFRSDASRNRATGGYGLGLAIAKSIIDKHKFKLFVDNAEGKSVCFIVTMN